MTNSLRVRLIDDDDDLRMAQRQMLDIAGIEIEDFPDARSALTGLDRDYRGIVLTDVRMPGMDGIQLFRHIHAMDPDLPVILLTGHADVDMAVSALHAGAYDFLTKPIAGDVLTASLRRALATRALVLENRRLRQVGDDAALAHPQLMGDSPAMVHLRDALTRVSEAQSDALIIGPSGAGKSLVARAIHRQGPRRSKAFVTLDCTNTTDTGLEAMLLGQQPALGARHPRSAGLLEKAHRGILCLEDVTVLPQAAQIRLLNLIEAGEYWPAGTAAPRPLDIQIIATANHDDPAAFHQGLYYRLSRAVLRVPPLSERMQDIPALFRSFLQTAADRLSRGVPPLTDLVMARLSAHPWPGNLRELQAFAEHHILGLTPNTTQEPQDRPPLPDMVAAYEAELIRDALRECQGHATEAMSRLGLPRKTFYDKLTRHGIRPADFRT
ncbi:sigma-54 dependent transcriptional regulator [Paracoccus sp. JM45]|uniref:sigma-54-dependent transcriptional regulator n=1 Tax=Paracoccus sp. JM45 TaxID=2283626 RepID=UPI000E6BF4F7|nr:sigma-54 dependent transcriptional regulator [Paracoccus sp. JM45]RJE80228.1 sigma-54-dependent Fis family transcriptional regulator [Paracoccus sp. JM45]